MRCVAGITAEGGREEEGGSREGDSELEKAGPSSTLQYRCPRRVRGAAVRPCPSARQPVREALECASGSQGAKLHGAVDRGVTQCSPSWWLSNPAAMPLVAAQQPPCSSVPMLVGVRVRRQRSAEDGSSSNARPTGVETPGLCR